MTEVTQYRIGARTASGLVQEVEAALAAGQLEPGEHLPSVRRLAAEAGLSPATVAAGLAELRRRGVVVTEPRRGTRIGERPPLAAGPRPMAVPAGARDLSRGNPDPALLPDLGEALARCEQPVRLYGEAPELRELIEHAGQAFRADGVPDQHMCVVSGALDAIERVLQARLRPGDRVAVESPGYAALYDLLRALGLHLDPVPLDSRGVTPDGLLAALRRGASAVVVTPRGQNPTGAALDAERASALREILASHPEVLLIEDDHLGPVAGAPLYTLAAAGGPWAATRSVAKALGPDLRLAVLSGDEATISRVRGRALCGPGWVSHVLQRLVATMWADPAVADRVALAGRLYAQRREGLLRGLASRGIVALGSSGLNVWVEVDDEAGAMSSLLARGWVVAPGARYKLTAGSPAIRITTAALGEADAERLAGDLAEILSPAPASRNG
ncbi:MAG TPA: aminotransferase class I/II-fold pyridoxal phosphate-dependent enzyme [Solirubrobacteraceae bacterium]|nr:aminotransferase class I/II-fold pyridoxal phosphate-dependent enzyme [Solirubrobacteraceae bacterium]